MIGQELVLLIKSAKLGEVVYAVNRTMFAGSALTL